MNNYKFKCNIKPVCPYCEFEDYDVWELDLESNGCETENECPNCEKEYVVSINTGVTYNTYSMEDGESNE